MCQSISYSQAAGNPSISSFPQEIFLHIFKHIDYQSLAKVAQVCKEWKNYAYDASVWKFRLETDHHFTVENPFESPVWSYRQIYNIRHNALRNLTNGRYKKTTLEWNLMGNYRPFFYLENNRVFILEQRVLRIFDSENGKLEKEYTSIPIWNDSSAPLLTSDGEITHCAVASPGRLLMGNSKNDEAIYDLFSDSFIFSCEGKILYEHGDYVVVYTKKLEVEIREIISRAIVYRFPSIIQCIPFRDAKDGLFAFIDQIHLYTYDLNTNGFWKISLEKTTQVDGLRIVSKGIVALQTSTPALLLFDIVSGKQVKNIPYVLFPVRSRRGGIMPQTSFKHMILYEPTNVSRGFFVFDTASMKIKGEYDLSLYEDFRVYVVNKCIVVLTNQPSSLYVFDLTTHQLLHRHDFGDTLLLHAASTYSRIEDGYAHNIFPFRVNSLVKNEYGLLDLSSGKLLFPFASVAKEKEQHPLFQFAHGKFVDSSWKQKKIGETECVNMKLSIHDFTRSEISLSEPCAIM
jgi:hypothetical protein